MATEGLKIVIGADVNNAVQGLKTFKTAVQGTDEVISDIVSSSANVEDALDKLGKQGLLSINTLEIAIKGFREGMKEATDPADIQKFGAAITSLKARQDSLISNALPDHIDKIGHSAGGSVVATQRLSSSLLGLSNHLDILPPEISGIAHGFDQLIQGFERVTEGTEGAGEKVAKFAGVLGQVGLGLAISVVIGLLVDFVKGLLDTDSALEQVTQRGSEVALAFDKMNKSLSDNKEALGFIQNLSDTFANIKFGSGFDTDLVKLQGHLATLKEGFTNLGVSLTSATQLFESEFGRMQGNVSEETADIIRKFGTLSNIPEAVIKNLPDVDKGLIENAQKAFEKRLKIQEDFNKNFEEQLSVEGQIRELRANKEREDNKALDALLNSRAAIIDEFTKKFASIGDPFPKFLSDNLPLGKVNDKLLRAGLESTFKLFDAAFRDLADKHKINPATIPVEIKFKPEIVGKTDLVRSIEDSFGPISKEVQDGLNKGIFTIHPEFTVAPEGDGEALKLLEDRIKSFLSQVQSLTGQEEPRLDISPEFLATLTPEKLLKTISDLKKQIEVAASGVPIKVEGKTDVKIVVDKDKVARDLAKDINDAVQSAARDIFTGIGETIGDALSAGINGGGIKDVLGAISNLIATVGKALIKAGVELLGLQKVIDKLATNPALAIGLGIALVALSRVMSNQIQNARELGGPVQRSMTYLVNEGGKQEMFVPADGSPARMITGGQQLFTPETSGKIVPAWLAKAMALRMGIPALESGAAVSGPTFSLLGEGFGISSINPEVVAPLQSIKSLLAIDSAGSNITVTGEISGRVLKLVQRRDDRFVRRNS